MNKGQRCKAQGARFQGPCNKMQVVRGKLHSGTMRLEPSNSRLSTFHSQLKTHNLKFKTYNLTVIALHEIRFTSYSRVLVHLPIVF
jgi:hypothetical protein